MRGEVGGDDSRQLVFIAVGDEVDDGTEHIAVFDDFARLGTKVIYCQDSPFVSLMPILMGVHLMMPLAYSSTKCNSWGVRSIGKY